MKYKTVSGTAHLVADSLSDLETRVGWIADKINKEAEGGWQPQLKKPSNRDCHPFREEH